MEKSLLIVLESTKLAINEPKMFWKEWITILEYGLSNAWCICWYIRYRLIHKTTRLIMSYITTERIIIYCVIIYECVIIYDAFIS